MKQKKELMERIAKIIDVEEIDLDYKIEKNTFDSLGILALSAAIDDVYDVIVPVAELRKVTAIKEIFDLVKEAGNE